MSFGYDADGILVRAGSIFLTREPASGRLASLSVGLAGETFGYTAYGELASYQARSASGVLLDMALAYDALGRLEEKHENGLLLRRSRSPLARDAKRNDDPRLHVRRKRKSNRQRHHDGRA